MASGTQIAQAYVQIIPTTEGMTKKIKESLMGDNSSIGSVGEEYGKTIGSKITSTIAKLGIGVSIGKTIASSIKNAASYEQLTGGVETLFKSSADQVIQNAQKAYQTAGVSANKYMEQITSFSASLISSLGGDTAKAAEVGNRAIIDMADNANKMGTSIDSIQNAYQGFAKQNFTMLDNLKLGYGGTKTEMERLISDASRMTDIQNQLNIKVNEGDLSFANIVNAISVMQKSLGIAGATAQEAATTIEGSVNMMKAAWDNLKTAIGTGLNVDQAANDFVNSIRAVMNNIVPIIVAIGPNLISAMSSVIVQLAPVVVDGIGQIFLEAFKQIPQIFASMNPIGKVATAVIIGLTGIKAAGDFSSAINSSIQFAASIMKIVTAKAAAATAATAAAAAETADATAKTADAGATTALGVASTAAAPGILAVAAPIVAVALAVAAIAIAIAACTGKLDGFVDSFKGLGQSANSAGNGLNNMVPGVYDATNGMNALENSTSGVANNLNAISGSSLSGMSTGLSSVSSAVDSASQSFNSLNSSTTNASEGMRSMEVGWSDIAAAMKNDANGIVREYQQTYQETESYAGYLEMSRNATRNAYASLSSDAREYVNQAYSIMNEGGSRAANAFETGWSGKSPELERAIEETLRNNHAIMSSNGDVYREAGSLTADNYTLGATNSFKKAQKDFGDSAKLLAGATRAGWETKIGDIENAILKTMRDTGKSARDAARDYESIGKYMAEGIIRGWSSGDVSKTISKDMEKTVKDAKDAAGVHSPSIYFRQIGEYMVEGLEIGLSGISNVYDKVITSTKNLVRTGLNEAANTNVRLLSSYAGTPDAPDNTEQKMNQILDNLSKLQINTNVRLEGDAGKLFTAIQDQNRVFRNSTGRSAFA